MSEFTARDRHIVASAYEVEADLLERIPTWNPFKWFALNAIAAYLRNRAETIRGRL